MNKFGKGMEEKCFQVRGRRENIGKSCKLGREEKNMVRMKRRKEGKEWDDTK